MITIFKCTSSHTRLNGCSSGDLFILICRHNRNRKIHQITISFVLVDLLINTTTGPLSRFWWSVCLSMSQRILWVSVSLKDSDLYLYNLVLWSNFNLLHNSQSITFPTHSYLVLYSFWASLQHLLIMWLTVSSVSPYKLHLQFYTYDFYEFLLLYNSSKTLLCRKCSLLQIFTKYNSIWYKAKKPDISVIYFNGIPTRHRLFYA